MKESNKSISISISIGLIKIEIFVMNYLKSKEDINKEIKIFRPRLG